MMKVVSHWYRKKQDLKAKKNECALFQWTTSSEEIWRTTMDNELEVLRPPLYWSDVNYDLNINVFIYNEQDEQSWMFIPILFQTSKDNLIHIRIPYAVMTACVFTQLSLSLYDIVPLFFYVFCFCLIHFGIRKMFYCFIKLPNISQCLYVYFILINTFLDKFKMKSFCISLIHKCMSMIYINNTLYRTV